MNVSTGVGKEFILSRIEECWNKIKINGAQLDVFVKLGFELAVDQANRAHDQTLEADPDPGCFSAHGLASPIPGP